MFDASASLNSLLTHAPVGLAFLDRDLRYLAVNDVMAAANGLEPAAHIGRSIADVIPDLVPVLEPLMRRVLDLGEPITNLAVERASPAGRPSRHFLCTYFPVRTATGAITGIGALVSETTDLRRSDEARQVAQDALADSEDRRRRLLSAMPDMVFRLDADGRHLEYYAPSDDGLYSPPDAIIGRTVAEMLPAPVSDLYREVIGEVIGGGKAREFQDELTFPDGRLHLYDARMVPTASREVLVLVRDVTEHRALEARLTEAQHQLLHAQKMEAVGRLAGGIAHDFNNLLTIISGSAQLLGAMVASRPEALGLLDEIVHASDTAAQLTRQLLAFGRRQQLKLEVLSVGDVVNGMERLMRRTLPANIELAPRLAPGTVRVDRVQLEQVIMNLAVNARDAMPQGGRLTIETAGIVLTDDRDVPRGDYVRLTIRDTGEGMDSHVLAHLFEPFFTTKPQGKGTGLGLPTVYGIVEQVGGHIRVESALRQGTSVHIYFPRVEDEGAAAVEGHAATHGLALGTGCVLLVEDNASVRRLAASMLRRCGYDVLEAENASAALEVIAQRDRADILLLLTDIVMPGMSGPELAVHARRLLPNLAVLLMSGYAGDALGSGDTPEKYQIVQKPFTLAQLSTAVKTAIESGYPFTRPE